MKVTITQEFIMEIEDEHYPNDCLDELVNDLNGLYDNVGKTITDRCEYQNTKITEVNGESVMIEDGSVNFKGGYEIVLDGKEI